MSDLGFVAGGPHDADAARATRRRNDDNLKKQRLQRQDEAATVTKRDEHHAEIQRLSPLGASIGLQKLAGHFQNTSRQFQTLAAGTGNVHLVFGIPPAEITLRLKVAKLISCVCSPYPDLICYM